MITPTPLGIHPVEIEIARNIEDFLAAKRLTRKSLHDAAGVSRPTFDRAMAGGRSFTVNEILKIANALGVHPAEILPGSITNKGAA